MTRKFRSKYQLTAHSRGVGTESAQGGVSSGSLLFNSTSHKTGQSVGVEKVETPHYLDHGGFGAEIDTYLDSDEYQTAFGEAIVPDYRGYHMSLLRSR